MLYMEPTKRYTLKSFPFVPVDDPLAINAKYEDIMNEYPDAQFKQVLNIDGVLGMMLMFV